MLKHKHPRDHGGTSPAHTDLDPSIGHAAHSSKGQEILLQDVLEGGAEAGWEKLPNEIPSLSWVACWSVAFPVSPLASLNVDSLANQYRGE